MCVCVCVCIYTWEETGRDNVYVRSFNQRLKLPNMYIITDIYVPKYLSEWICSRYFYFLTVITLNLDNF